MKLSIVTLFLLLAMGSERFRRGANAEEEGAAATEMDSNVISDGDVTTEEALTPAKPTLSPGDAFLYRLIGQASQMWQHKVGTGIHTYYMPVMSILGLVGNILSVIVMAQPSNRELSACIYIIALALSDSICLSVGFSHWVMTDTPILSMRRPMDENRWECKIVGYISACAQLTSVFIVCAMTSERLLAVRDPLKARRLCSPKRTRITIGYLAVIACIIRIPYVFHTEPLGARDCVAYLVKAPWITAMYWINIIISYWAPFFLLLIMNCVIIHTFRNRKKFFQADKKSSDYTSDQTAVSIAPDGVSGGDKQASFKGAVNTGFEGNESPESPAVARRERAKKAKSDQDKRDETIAAKELQLTVMLLTVTFAFLILLFPIYAGHIVYQVKSYLSSSQAYADYILVANIGIKLIYTNNAINFYLYCLSGSKFRSDLKNLLCFCRRQ